MTILAEIKAAFPTLTQATRNDEAIAAKLSIGRTKIVSTKIGIGQILATLGANGGIFLDELSALGATDRNVFWAMELIKAGELDVGMSATIAQVNALAVANPAIAGSCNALLALAHVPDPVTEYDVRCALQDADGNWLGG
jgi:23S rRNA A1618 N6-methylase RlmF